MTDATDLKRINIVVTGVPGEDRVYFCGIIRNYLIEHHKVDPVFDCKDGGSRTVAIDCCEFRFPSIRLSVIAALKGHYVDDPILMIKPMHDKAAAIAA